MADLLLFLPIAIPFLSAGAAFLLRHRSEWSRAASILGSIALFVVSVILFARVLDEGVVAAQMGGWPAPFGITLVADFLSAVMVLITGVIGLAVAVYGLGEVDRRLDQYGFQALYQVLLAGVCGAFLTGDLFNLYVWFEVMLIASFGLLVLGGNRAQMEGGIKYVALNIVATVFFLTAIGLLYGLTGTLNMADLAGRVAALDDTAPVLAVALLFLVAFGIKSAVFPLFFWLPAAYHTPNVTVSAVFAGLLTKVGVYALIRVFTLVFDGVQDTVGPVLVWIAVLTMVTGVLGAAAQNQIRKILSFHIISQIGYMVLGLALWTPLALVGAVFYLIHHIIVKANLFLIAGVVRVGQGSFELKHLGGLYVSKPWLGLLFLIPAFSLAGFPPLSGFWAKFLVVKASLDAEAYLVAFFALLVGLFTVFSMVKIWMGVFWDTPPDRPAEDKDGYAVATATPGLAMIAPVVALAAITVAIGLYSQPMVVFAEQAADQILNPSAYIAAVLGGRP